MTVYRIFRLKPAGALSDYEVFEAQNDAEAVKVAKAAALAEPVELWEDGRLVAAASPRPA